MDPWKLFPKFLKSLSKSVRHLCLFGRLIHKFLRRGRVASPAKRHGELRRATGRLRRIIVTLMRAGRANLFTVADIQATSIDRPTRTRLQARPVRSKNAERHAPVNLSPIVSATRRRWRESDTASSSSEFTGFGFCCGRSRRCGGVISASPQSNYDARRRAPCYRPSVSFWRTSGGNYPSSARRPSLGSRSRCSSAAANIQAAYAGHTAASRGDRSITRSRRTPYHGWPTGFYSATNSYGGASGRPWWCIGVRYLPL